MTFITIAGEGHGRFTSDELKRRVAAFFEKHLRDQNTEIPGGIIGQAQGVDRD